MEFIGCDYLLGGAAAKDIFAAIAELPIVDPHNHADVAEIAANRNYPDPWKLFAATDHYVWEVLRKRGVPEEYVTGKAAPEEKWLKMAEVFPTLAGNPVYEWIHLDLKRYLGVRGNLGPETGKAIWDEASAVLAGDDKKPQALLRQIGVETMCSTDDPIDSLEHHRAVEKDFGRKMIRPTWRPDKAMNITAPKWNEYIDSLGKRFSKNIDSFESMLDALAESHEVFAAHGCVASDHGVEVPHAGGDEATAREAFKKRRGGGELSATEKSAYMGAFLEAVGEMDAARNWVFQLHIGAVRDVRDSLFQNLGPDSGGDVSNIHQDILPPLKSLLNRFDGRLKTVLYCLDPHHQPTLGTISRAFGAKVNLGSAWWLCDTPVGMRRQLEYIGSVDLLANFAGMVSDSRKLLSYGSRFEMFRRILADVLGRMVELGQMPSGVAAALARRMSYDGPKEFFNL